MYVWKYEKIKVHVPKQYTGHCFWSNVTSYATHRTTTTSDTDTYAETVSMTFVDASLTFLSRLAAPPLRELKRPAVVEGGGVCCRVWDWYGLTLSW